MKKFVALFVFFSLFILALLSFSYFQQDEWHTFGVLQAYGGLKYLTSGSSLLDFLFTDRIGSRFIMMTLFNIFHTNGSAFGIVSALFHILNSILIFLVALKLTKNRKIGYLSSLFFLVNSVADQSFIWFGTMAGTLPSMTFTLISLIFYLNFLKNRKLFTLISSLVFIFISFLFKEGAYSMFIVYPVLWFVYTDKKNLKLFIKENIYILVYALFMSLLYIKDIIFISGDRVNYIAPQTSGGIMNLLSHLVLYPLAGLSQIFIPTDFILNISKKLSEIFFPAVLPGTIEFDLLYSIKISMFLSIFVSLMIGLAFYFSDKKLEKMGKHFEPKILKVSLLIILLSFIPFTVLNASSAFLDSRYYYPSLLGAAISFGIISTIILEKAKKGIYRNILVLLIVAVLGCQAMVLGLDLVNQFQVSQERIYIMDSIAKNVPHLEDKTLFYVSGDSGGYYGLPQLKVPFQSGLGEMLMVSYDDPTISSFFKEDTEVKTFNGGFLWDIVSQGYKEKGNRGFGYFTDKDELENTVRQYKIDVSRSIFAFYYESESKTLVNITSDFRKEVEKDINE